MNPHQKNQSESNKASSFPPAGGGNASNPAPQAQPDEPAGSGQLLDEQAEKYLREGGNIEDMPDEQDWQKADETIRQTNDEP